MPPYSIIEAVLIAQCVLVPAALLLAGPTRVYNVANAWVSLFALEVFGAIGLYLTVVWKHRRADFAPMLMILGGTATLQRRATSSTSAAARASP